MTWSRWRSRARRHAGHDRRTAATSAVTTAPAPTIAPLPTVTPGRMTAFTPMSAQAPMRTGLISRSVCDDRHVRRHAGVLRAEHLGARPPADVLLDHQIARVEVALRADPDVVADHAAAVEAALDDRLLADEPRRRRSRTSPDAGRATPRPIRTPSPKLRASARQIARRISASKSLSPCAKRPYSSQQRRRRHDARAQRRPPARARTADRARPARRPWTAGTTRLVACQP